jgi:mRNA interferase MazF
VEVAEAVISRGQVYLVRLDPTLGSEIKKTRPCVVVSPDELNEHLRTVIIAPMTTGRRAYPWRPRCRFQGRVGFVALDQLRTVDSERLVKRLGRLEGETVVGVLERLQEMFAVSTDE